MTPHFMAHVIHILESIEEAQDFVKSCKTMEAFEEDRKTYLALLRVLQTLSESACKLPSDIKERHGSIDWRRYQESRNALVHDYLGDYEPNQVWQIVQEDLPVLYQAMRSHIPNWEEIRDSHKKY